MEILINSKNIDIGDAFRTHIRDHMTQMVGRYFSHTFDVTVTISKDAHIVDADISAHVGRGIMLRSNEGQTDPYIAFDTALAKMEKRLRRYKQRLKSHHNKHEEKEEKKAIKYILSHDFGLSHEEELPADGAQPAIIAETSADLPALSVSDAVMRMDLAEAPVFVFYNAAHKGLNILYRRNDGNIGWIDPEGIKYTKKIA